MIFTIVDNIGYLKSMTNVIDNPTWKCGIIIFCLSAACFWGCFSNEREKFPKEIKINANNFDIKSNNNQSIWCVVSASAGDIPRYTYLTKTRTLSLDSSLTSGWDFLPLPANQSYVVDAIGRNKLPIEMMIISERIHIGQTIQVKPIGALEVSNGREKKAVLIGIPTDHKIQIIEPTVFADFMIDYDPIKYLLQSWYINHRGVGTFDVVQWQNEQFANSIINEGIKYFNEQ